MYVMKRKSLMSFVLIFILMFVFCMDAFGVDLGCVDISVYCEQSVDLEAMSSHRLGIVRIGDFSMDGLSIYPSFQTFYDFFPNGVSDVSDDDDLDLMIRCIKNDIALNHLGFTECHFLSRESDSSNVFYCSFRNLDAGVYFVDFIDIDLDINSIGYVFTMPYRDPFLQQLSYNYNYGISVRRIVDDSEFSYFGDLAWRVTDDGVLVIQNAPYRCVGWYNVNVIPVCNDLFDKTFWPWIDDADRIVSIQCDACFRGNVSYLFRGLYNLSSFLNFNSFSNVTDMTGLFEGCRSLTSVPDFPHYFTSWNVNSVTSVRDMFKDCTSLVSVEDQEWTVDHLTDISGMFKNCSSLVLVPYAFVGSLLDNCTDMSELFAGCSSLTSVALPSTWDLSHVTDMHGIFSGCSNLEELDIRYLDITGIDDISGFFPSAPCELKRVVLGENFDFVYGTTSALVCAVTGILVLGDRTVFLPCDGYTVPGALPTVVPTFTPVVTPSPTPSSESWSGHVGPSVLRPDPSVEPTGTPTPTPTPTPTATFTFPPVPLPDSTEEPPPPGASTSPPRPPSD